MKSASWRHLAAAAAEDMWDKRGDLTPRGLCAISSASAAIVCYLTFHTARWYSPALCAHYRNLKFSERRDWDTRYFSCLHAAVVSYLSYVALVQEDTFYRVSDTPVLLRSSYVTYLSLGLSLGYFVVDLGVCLRYKVGGTAMALHHSAALASVIWASWSGFGHMPTLWLLGTEFTTPFINLRWWMDKAGMKSSDLYLYNGLTIVVSWFFARILIFIPFYCEVWRVRDELAICDWPTVVLLLGVPVLLTGLNCLWFTQIVKGATKAVLNSQAASRLASSHQSSRANSEESLKRE